jgi:23S rRNA pseudouridine1911/1915/1917 synthase
LDLELEFTVSPESEGVRLDIAFVASLEGVSRSRAQAWIRAGRVSVDGEVRDRPGLHVRSGQVVALKAQVATEQTEERVFPPLELLYEDADLLVVCKPAGLLTHANHEGERSVSGDLNESHGPLPEGDVPLRAGIVHRLDRDTSGVLVVARNQTALASLQGAFRERRVQKTYEGIVAGTPRFDSDWIDAPLGRSAKHHDRQSVLSKEEGREALTYWEVIERFDGYAHVRLQPKTGRTHQLRVHLSSIDLAIVSDPLYRSKGGRPARLPVDAPALERHALHAEALSLPHPTSGEEVSFSVPRPTDMEAALAWLRSERAGA